MVVEEAVPLAVDLLVVVDHQVAHHRVAHDRVIAVAVAAVRVRTRARRARPHRKFIGAILRREQLHVFALKAFIRVGACRRTTRHIARIISAHLRCVLLI